MKKIIIAVLFLGIFLDTNLSRVMGGFITIDSIDSISLLSSPTPINEVFTGFSLLRINPVKIVKKITVGQLTEEVTQVGVDVVIYILPEDRPWEAQSVRTRTRIDGLTDPVDVFIPITGVFAEKISVTVTVDGQDLNLLEKYVVPNAKWPKKELEILNGGRDQVDFENIVFDCYK